MTVKEQLFQQAVSQERKRELALYKRYASNPDFKRTFDASIMQLLTRSSPEQINYSPTTYNISV